MGAGAVPAPKVQPRFFRAIDHPARGHAANRAMIQAISRPGYWGETLQDKASGTQQAWRGPSGLPWDVQPVPEYAAGPEGPPSGLGAPMALSQEAAMRRMIEQTAKALREMAGGFESLGDSVGRYPAPPEDGSGSRLAVYTAEFLTDPAEIVEALLDAGAVATNQILSMFPGPVAKSAELAEEVERTGYVRSRGVAVRSIYAESFFKSPNGAKHLRELTELGVQIRLLGSVPFRLIVSDTVTMMSGPQREDAPSLAVLRPEFLARAARQALEYWWITATPLEDLVRDLHNGPTPQEQAILRLMLAGVRDEAIAREIGVSIRTFRRNLATLMNKLGTENRFQAGVKASAKGWL